MARLRSLAERLLLLASAEQPSFLRPHPVSPATLVDAAWRRWAPIPRTWAIIQTATREIDADADRLAAALDALIENAVAYTQEGDRIELRLHPEGNDVVIAVADEGTGIAPEHLENILGRFARSDAGRERNPAGVGLGLDIAKTIAEAHGGVLRVTSALGQGTVFELVLPATTRGRAEPLSLPTPLASDAVGSR
jgi:signal transduction histidine kinase